MSTPADTPTDFVRDLLKAGVQPPDAVKLVRGRYGLRLGDAIHVVEVAQEAKS